MCINMVLYQFVNMTWVRSKKGWKRPKRDDNEISKQDGEEISKSLTI